jgi:hypothetical protein
MESVRLPTDVKTSVPVTSTTLETVCACLWTSAAIVVVTVSPLAIAIVTETNSTPVANVVVLARTRTPTASVTLLTTVRTFLPATSLMLATPHVCSQTSAVCVAATAFLPATVTAMVT